MFAWTFVVLSLGIVLCAISTEAKRKPPKPVSPIVASAIRYSAAGDGRNQYVVAEDAADGKELWRVKIFENRINSSMEEDVQWVFITDLKLADNSLLIRDEKSRCYSLDLATKHLKKLPCLGIF
jgi:hypothetical protein